MKINNRHLSILEHIDELRQRVIRASLVVLVMTVGAYMYTDNILRVIAKPVGHLIFIDPSEAFMTYLKVAFWAGLFLSSPYVIFEIWQFIAAGLAPRERKYVYIIMPASFLLFVTGVYFGFTFVITAGIKFLLSFGHDFMTPTLTISSYVSFVASMCLAFGAVFQLPIVMAFLTQIGLITPAVLVNKWRYAVVLIFIAAGVLTPSPDIFSQFCMAVPLLFLYVVSIIVSQVIYQRAQRMIGQEPLVE
ncbi:MAG: twin-arginine translocase subunit TatC [Candidatus Omnitrophica bacterium]|nr:twin-arginine translocase subunit TatC [Candidatus Omnitrophota bacterium]